jgi:hypothetical protein
MIALEPLPAFVPCYTEGYAIFRPELFELSHTTRCDYWSGFYVEEIYE